MSMNAMQAMNVSKTLLLKYSSWKQWTGEQPSKTVTTKDAARILISHEKIVKNYKIEN